MNSPKACKLSYIRAFREVIPSTSLKEFLKTAHDLTKEETFEAVTDPLVYAVNSLRVTLFERRVKASQDVNDLLRKLHARMETPFIFNTERVRTTYGALKTTQRRQRNPLHLDLDDAKSLYVQNGSPFPSVRSNVIVDCTKDDYKGSGVELALVIDEGTGASILEAQRDILFDTSRRINAGKRLPRADEPDPVLHLPFMQAPFASDGQRDEFMKHLTVELPVHDIGFGPIEWQLKTSVPNSID